MEFLMKFYTLSFQIALLACVWPASVWAADFYVSTDGDDSHSGTQAAEANGAGPFASLDRAVTARAFAPGMIASDIVSARYQIAEWEYLGSYDWSELTQAKWALRRLLGDLGRDIPSSYFSIIDMHYAEDGINRKGLLFSNDAQTVGHEKQAYRAGRVLTGTARRMR